MQQVLAAPDRGYFIRASALFAIYDPLSQCWKTSQLSLVEDGENAFEAWPRSGMMLNGGCYLQGNTAPHINAKGFLQSLGTPTASDATKMRFSVKVLKARFGKKSKHNLAEQIAVLTGQTLSPAFVTWIMGYPEGWLNLRYAHWGTRCFRSYLTASS